MAAWRLSPAPGAGPKKPAAESVAAGRGSSSAGQQADHSRPDRCGNGPVRRLVARTSLRNLTLTTPPPPTLAWHGPWVTITFIRAFIVRTASLRY